MSYMSYVLMFVACQAGQEAEKGESECRCC